MLRWPDYFVDPPNDTTSGDVNVLSNLQGFGGFLVRSDCLALRRSHHAIAHRCHHDHVSQIQVLLNPCLNSATEVESTNEVISCAIWLAVWNIPESLNVRGRFVASRQ